MDGSMFLRKLGWLEGQTKVKEKLIKQKTCVLNTHSFWLLD